MRVKAVTRGGAYGVRRIYFCQRGVKVCTGGHSAASSAPTGL